MENLSLKAKIWKWIKSGLIAFFLLSFLITIINTLVGKNNSNGTQEMSSSGNINNTGTVQKNTENTEQKPSNLANTGVLSSSGDTNQGNEDLGDYIEKNQLTIITQCKSAVRGMLKSPGSADFPFASYDIKSDKGIIMLKSYVDAKNAFGASIRSNFSCYLSPSGKTPIVIDIKFYE